MVHRELVPRDRVRLRRPSAAERSCRAWGCLGKSTMNCKQTVDGRNPTPVDGWFIHVYPIIYRVYTIQGGAGFLPSTVWEQVCLSKHF